MLLPTSAEIAAPFVSAFRQGLHDRGYIEKQNIAIEYRWTDGTAHKVALELVGLKVDVINPCVDDDDGEGREGFRAQAVQGSELTAR